MKLSILVFLHAFVAFGNAEVRTELTEPVQSCKICTLVVKIVQDQVQFANFTLDVAENIAEEVCKILTEQSQKDLCNKIVKDIKIIADMIMSKMDVSEICKKLGFCDTNTIPAPVLVKARKLNGKTCKTCKKVVAIVSSVLKITNSTVQEVTQMVKGICKVYPESETECAKITDQIELVMKLITEKLSPGDICAQLGICTNSLQKSPSLKSYDPCETCHLVVNIVDEVLDVVNATTGQVVQIVKEICKSYPGFYEECSKISDQVEEIIELLTTGLTPDGICKKLGICPNIKQMKSVKIATDAAGCDTCKMVVTVVKKVVQEVDDSLPAVEEAIKTICSLTGVPHLECSVIVTMASEIIKLVEKEYDIDTICIEIGLCTKRISYAPRSLLRDHSITKDCPMCRYMVQVVTMALEWGIPQQNIKNTINFVCGLFKQKHEYVQCTKFSDNLDNIMDMLNSGKTPEQICEWLGKCSTKEISELKLTQVHMYQNNASCETCKSIVKLISNIIKEFDSNLKEIEDTVDEMCSLLGDKEAQCKKISGEVFESIGAVLQMLEGDLDPETICKTIAHVCP